MRRAISEREMRDPQEMVQEHDEAVLKSLYDITVTFNKDPMVSHEVPCCSLSCNSLRITE